MKIKDTIIIINSSNRADKVVTHKMFKNVEMEWLYAVPVEQHTQYLNNPNISDHIITIPEEVPQFLSSQRQWVMENFTKEGYKYVWFMDDDLTFFRRVDMRLKKCKKKHVAKMVNEVRKHLTEMPVVAISTRLGNNRVVEDYDETNRITRCYAMSTKAFVDVGATFAPFEPFLAQDFHINLCFLNKGYNNRILYTYAQEDIGSNAEGGCSVYRNQELQKRVSFWMADNHPEVTVKVKSSKNWKGYKGARVDMVVQWKKAYKPVKKRTRGGLRRLLNK
ncbi:MAG: hypothetical protein DRO67_00405 [Candidatus Asgardarchaeum californiense]|nr:MAG: hypothetical protein DRO67_00405 [Candidatus Asgardarchaeum californiense]